MNIKQFAATTRHRNAGSNVYVETNILCVDPIDFVVNTISTINRYADITFGTAAGRPD